MKVLGLCVLFILTPTLAGAAAKNTDADFALVGRYSSYSDLQTSDSTSEPVEMTPTYELELDLRIRSFFSLALVTLKSTDSLHTSLGGGFRVDTPGFFWIGGSRSSGRRAQRNYPVNTSIFGFIMQSQIKSAPDASAAKALGTNMGLSLDIFLFNRYVFLTGQASLLNMQSNGFLVSSFGLGAEF